MSDRTCSIEGCTMGGEITRGWCKSHYNRWHRYGDPLGCRAPQPTVCIIEGCTGLVQARGWCGKHYTRWRKHGDPLADERPVRATCSEPECGKPAKGQGLCATHYGRWRLEHADPCSVEGCDAAARARGFCNLHYKRWRTYGNPLEGARPQNSCSVEGCNAPYKSTGYCSRHLSRWRQHGDPLREPPSAEDRFWPNVDRSGPVPDYAPDLGPCWLWTASVAPNGYGKFSWNQRQNGAHRFSYELQVGAIPDGLHLDHLCRVRACVNPAHLEPVPCRENLRRGEGFVAVNAAKTSCDSGHEFTEANTKIDRRGHRACRECMRIGARERSRAAAAARQASIPPRTHCVNGHEWIPGNLIQNSKGAQSCHPCQLAAYVKYKAKKRGKAA